MLGGSAGATARLDRPYAPAPTGPNGSYPNVAGPVLTPRRADGPQRQLEQIVPVSAAVDEMTFMQVVRATAEAGLVGDVSRSHEYRCLWRPHAPSEQVTGPPVRRPGSSRAGSRRAIRGPASPASHGSLDSQSIVRAHPTVRRSGPAGVVPSGRLSDSASRDDVVVTQRGGDPSPLAHLGIEPVAGDTAVIQIGIALDQAMPTGTSHRRG